ncbi:MAG: prephenate dehydrogenase/arogenate dehydrogenase family protein, partial [Candidatus Nanopelagicaceae bacterium]
QFHGPAAAQADLFKNRPWILTPLTQNSSEDVQRVGSLLSALGANLHRMTAEEHDAIFARVSHLPQILSTLLSATLRDQPGAVAFSGQGFRDMTRLAESDGGLWAQIIPLNSEEILIALQEFKASLNKIERAIELNDASTILKVFQEGKSTRTLLAGKHGGVPRDYIFFRIVIDDRPGVLAELFALCGEVNVNVEDLTIEHSPNQETGLITLAIAPEHKTPLEMILNDRSWNFHLDPSLESLE